MTMQSVACLNSDFAEERLKRTCEVCEEVGSCAKQTPLPLRLTRLFSDATAFRLMRRKSSHSSHMRYGDRKLEALVTCHRMIFSVDFHRIEGFRALHAICDYKFLDLKTNKNYYCFWKQKEISSVHKD